MSAIENLIFQNYLQAKAIISTMEAERQRLPKGNLTYRTKGIYHYCHLQFRDADKKVNNQRVIDADIEKTKQLLDRRDTLKQEIQQLQKYIKILEKHFPHLCMDHHTPTDTVHPDKPFLTLKGDFVRSKSELIIANALYTAQISYEYEKEVFLNGWSYPIHPDFTIYTPRENLTVYWEHCGLMNDKSYQDRWERRQKAYNRTGFSEWNKNLIVTYEYDGKDLSMEDIQHHIAQLKKQ